MVLQSFSSSRTGVKICTSHSPEKGTRGAQTHRKSLLSNTIQDPRNTSIGWTCGYVKQYSKSLRKHVGGTMTAVAIQETWLHFNQDTS